MTTQELDDAVWRAYALYYGKRRLARRVGQMARRLPLRSAAAFAVGGAIAMAGALGTAVVPRFGRVVASAT